MLIELASWKILWVDIEDWCEGRSYATFFNFANINLVKNMVEVVVYLTEDYSKNESIWVSNGLSKEDITKFCCVVLL